VGAEKEPESAYLKDLSVNGRIIYFQKTGFDVVKCVHLVMDRDDW